MAWFHKVCAAMLIAASGCMATGDDLAQNDNMDATNVAPARIALRTGAAVAPDDIDGFCEDGVGVYLSANGEQAELTVYVVAPATSVTFARPTLRLTTMLDGSPTTDVSEFEDVTLNAGESRVFTAQTQGTLMDVAAEIEPQLLSGPE